MSVDRFAGDAIRAGLEAEAQGWSEAPLTRALMGKAAESNWERNPNREAILLQNMLQQEATPSFGVDVNAPGLSVPRFLNREGVIAPFDRSPMLDPLRGPSYLDKQKFIGITRPDSFAPLL